MTTAIAVLITAAALALGACGKQQVARGLVEAGKDGARTFRPPVKGAGLTAGGVGSHSRTDRREAANAFVDGAREHGPELIREGIRVADDRRKKRDEQ
jgi:hypothetical protein